MRRLLWAALVGSVLLVSPSTSRAQFVGGFSNYSASMSAFYATPGAYGMAYGYSSFGFPRTYTSFSSPYGGGYGYGYSPYGFLPGKYGVGLWRPGYTVPGYVYGASYYRTFPYSLRPNLPVAPVGAYAPGFGPPSFYSW